MSFKPLVHQVIGSQALRDHPAFALFDEMGAGKTKQVIDAAQSLFKDLMIERVVVVAPSWVRSVWYDPELGELQKHLWKDTPSRIIQYHAKNQSWDWFGEQGKHLKWIITNYEFIRQAERLAPLENLCDDKTLLVLDESSFIKNHKAKQTKACFKLRRACGRVVLLNGTPIGHSPADMFAQGNILDFSILQCKSYYHFLSRYAIRGGFQGRQILGWLHPYSVGCCTAKREASIHCSQGDGLEDLQKRFSPYVLRRLKIDCLDLPPKLEPITYEVKLSESTWKIYKEMRDEFMVWLDEQPSIAPQAIVKILRLSQICAGFLGGLVNLDEEEETSAPLPAKEIGSEKLDFILRWLTDRIEEDPKFKILIWCRFRPELQRLKKYVELLNTEVGVIAGGQKKSARQEALRLLDPATSPNSAVVVLGNPKAGGMGLNLTAAHHVMYVSNDTSLMVRLQSSDRVHRPGQTKPVSYFDVMAVGPQGQKTVERTIIKSLHDKEDLARWTSAAWRAELSS
jgi:SNF2 family DNA or RNA helicase